jgi:hypothetical protein
METTSTMIPKVGDLVEVRSKQEILSTLDGKGQLDGMPFMPEMFAFCGRRFPILKRAHKTCDTATGTGGRRLEGTVHLATRCDGAAHGGCQASCLLFWKEAWLKRVDGGGNVDQTGRASPSEPGSNKSGCTEKDVYAGTGEGLRGDMCNMQYVCQNTQVPFATTYLPWWDIRQYFEDYTSGNVGIRRIVTGGIYAMYYNLSQAGIGLGPALRWLYDRSYGLWNGVPWPRTAGPIPAGESTPTGTLDLKPGEWVRVKPHSEIVKTLNVHSKNRGLIWDAEMVPYCGGIYQVAKRVEKIIDERTGKMIWMKYPCIILDSVVCQSRYSGCRMFCPRAFYSYWREIWLERVDNAEGRVAAAREGEPPNAMA